MWGSQNAGGGTRGSVLDTAGVEVDAHALSDGVGGAVLLEAAGEHARSSVGLDDAAPDGTGVATASGSLGPADATLLSVTVVHVGNALADVPEGVLLGVHELGADEGGAVVGTPETALVTGEGALDVETGGGAITLDLAELALKSGDGLSAGEVGLTHEGGALSAADGLLDGGSHVFVPNKVQRLYLL